MGRLKTTAPRLKPCGTRLTQHRPPEAARQARRALATNSAAWRKLRASILAMEPLCRECAKKGRVTAASCVDHVDGDSHNNSTENLQPLCSPCHSRKTAMFDHGFGNPGKG